MTRERRLSVMDINGDMHDLVAVNSKGCKGCIGEGASPIIPCSALPNCASAMGSTKHGEAVIFVRATPENIALAVSQRMEESE